MNNCVFSEARQFEKYLLLRFQSEGKGLLQPCQSFSLNHLILVMLAIVLVWKWEETLPKAIVPNRNIAVDTIHARRMVIIYFHILLRLFALARLCHSQNHRRFYIFVQNHNSF